MIEILSATLRQHNVDKEQRESICGDFAFDFGMLHDPGGSENRQSDSLPVITFLEGDELYVGDGEFEFHEHAFRNAARCFAGKEVK